MQVSAHNTILATANDYRTGHQSGLAWKGLCWLT
jgi:hypothetical protein